MNTPHMMISIDRTRMRRASGTNLTRCATARSTPDSLPLYEIAIGIIPSSCHLLQGVDMMRVRDRIQAIVRNCPHTGKYCRLSHMNGTIEGPIYSQTTCSRAV